MYLEEGLRCFWIRFTQQLAEFEFYYCQIHCYDEYEARVDKDGRVSDQRARVRLFCLAFLSGSPFLEIGLNDRRREGKEVVRRKDILPMHTERWIRFEVPEFHETVEPDAWEQDQVSFLQ